MPVYNSIVTRENAAPFIPTQTINEIIDGTAQQSAFLRMARRLPNASSRTMRMSMLDLLPEAYFVNGDTGLKQTTAMAWANKYIYMEEIAVVVVIPENVIADADQDFWAAARPRIAEAMGKKIDAAALFSTGKPTDWPDGIVTQAVAKGNVVSLLDHTGDMYDAIFAEAGLFDAVEEDGYEVNGILGATNLRAKLRGIRDTAGQPLFLSSMQERVNYELAGVPIDLPKNGSMNGALARMVAGDWSEVFYSIRQDLTFKIFTEGVVSDGAGNVIFNLMQQDAVAMRAVMRLGWQIPNPINSVNPDADTRFPFAVLTD